MPRQKIEVYPQKRLSGGRVGNKTLVAKKQNKLQAVRFVAYSIVKRFFDLAISATFLILLSPIFLIIAIVIKIDSPGPVFFRQERTGKDGRVFKIYKFRSMAVDNNVWDDSCGDKYTRVGAVLRKTSIDELPQFINVFLGQMSFIGPRPWIPEYWTNMNEEERMRSKVRPGITGLAAAKGRNGLTIFEKIAYDLEYVRNFSLLQDVKIILLTFRQLFRSEEVSVGKAGIYNEIDWLRMRNCNDKKLNRKPLVSIIIPVFNGEKVILDTIDSLWKQTYKKWEAIFVDDDISGLLKSEKIRGVNGSKYLLIEFSLNEEFSGYKDLFLDLMAEGYKIILAHPERYVFIQKDFQVLQELSEMGVLLQVNLGSIAGKYGKKAEKVAKKIIKKRIAFGFGSDLHRPIKHDSLEVALKRLKKRYNEDELGQVLVKNPQLTLDLK